MLIEIWYPFTGERDVYSCKKQICRFVHHDRLWQIIFDPDHLFFTSFITKSQTIVRWHVLYKKRLHLSHSQRKLNKEPNSSLNIFFYFIKLLFLCLPLHKSQTTDLTRSMFIYFFADKKNVTSISSICIC